MSTVDVNFKTTVHKKSAGQSIAFPDVCKTPAPPAPFVPVPYPNIAMSSDTSMGTKKVKIQGSEVMTKGAVFSKSTGDEAGSIGGMVSQVIKGKAEPVMYSFDTKMDGQNVFRMMDPMMHNKGGSVNTPPTPELQAPIGPAFGGEGDPDELHAVEVVFGNVDGKLPFYYFKFKLSGPETIEDDGRDGWCMIVKQVPKGSYSLKIQKPDYASKKKSDYKAKYGV